jgi:hypothetical protein
LYFFHFVSFLFSFKFPFQLSFVDDCKSHKVEGGWHALKSLVRPKLGPKKSHNGIVWNLGHVPSLQH